MFFALSTKSFRESSVSCLNMLVSTNTSPKGLSLVKRLLTLFVLKTKSSTFWKSSMGNGFPFGSNFAKAGFFACSKIESNMASIAACRSAVSSTCLPSFANFAMSSDIFCKSAVGVELKRVISLNLAAGFSISRKADKPFCFWMFLLMCLVRLRHKHS